MQKQYQEAEAGGPWRIQDKPGPLEEQSVLFLAGPSLQPLLTLIFSGI